MLTPPVGFNLYAVHGIAKIPLPEVLKGTTPFFVNDLIMLAINVMFPALITWLPSVLVKSAFGG